MALFPVLGQAIKRPGVGLRRQRIYGFSFWCSVIGVTAFLFLIKQKLQVIDVLTVFYVNASWVEWSYHNSTRVTLTRVNPVCERALMRVSNRSKEAPPRNCNDVTHPYVDGAT